MKCAEGTRSNRLSSVFCTPSQRSQKLSVPDPARNSKAAGSKPADLEYFDETIRLLQELKRTQADAIRRAGELCADRIASGGLVFLFGNGHSRMMCEEMTPRQGCYA